MERKNSAFISNLINNQKRWQEFFFWLFFWINGMLLTKSSYFSSPGWSYVTIMIILLGTLTFGLMISIVYSIKTRELTPLIELIKNPNSKKKWIIFAIFFVLLVPSVLFSRFFCFNPTLAGIFFPGLLGYMAIFCVEWLAGHNLV